MFDNKELRRCRCRRRNGLCGKNLKMRSPCEDTKGLEAERKALGLEGVLFRYYTCSACNYADIFVDVHPLEGESEEAFGRRRDELEATIKQLAGVCTRDEDNAEDLSVAHVTAMKATDLGDGDCRFLLKTVKMIADMGSKALLPKMIAIPGRRPA